MIANSCCEWGPHAVRYPTYLAKPAHASIDAAACFARCWWALLGVDIALVGPSSSGVDCPIGCGGRRWWGVMGPSLSLTALLDAASGVGGAAVVVGGPVGVGLGVSGVAVIVGGPVGRGGAVAVVVRRWRPCWARWGRRLRRSSLAAQLVWGWA
jgi:hypothetical protein